MSSGRAGRGVSVYSELFPLSEARLNRLLIDVVTEAGEAVLPSRRYVRLTATCRDPQDADVTCAVPQIVYYFR